MLTFKHVDMYPKFHATVYSSTLSINTQAEGRGTPPGVSPGGTARRVVGRPATGHGKRRPGVSEGEDARACRVVFFVVVFRPFVVFVVVQSQPGDPSSRRQAIKLAAWPMDHSSGTHNFCMLLNLLNFYLLTFHMHLSLQPEAMIASGANSKVTYLCLGNHVFRGHSTPLLSTLVATSTVKIHIGE